MPSAGWDSMNYHDHQTGILQLYVGVDITDISSCCPCHLQIGSSRSFPLSSLIWFSQVSKRIFVSVRPGPILFGDTVLYPGFVNVNPAEICDPRGKSWYEYIPLRNQNSNRLWLRRLVILVPCFVLGILALFEGMLRLFNAEFGAPDAKKGQLSRPRSAPVEEGMVTGSIELII
ncbi:hypothetical protein EDD18DRAFT_290365 [Armillaria luteobubalina]|uniref:Uncharacterized protein n=1 Tax=Armillaria luteobubalina TaxID=153913 RepID=A0AA39UN32_9AGAR|nr:hypothetical protein EDD18DRAFT_290365 [Armillaria luteobubalina]